MLGRSGLSIEAELVAHYVRQGAWPFRVDPITITRETDHSQFGVSVFEVQTKNAGSFKYPVDDYTRSYLWDARDLVEQFGIAAARAFRNYRIEPETNIVLGEN